MSTRFKRSTIYRHFLIGAALVTFQAYLGYSAVNGQFGIENQRQMLEKIEALRAEQSSLQTQIDAYKLRIDLFNPTRLDPDLLSEKARALLSMAEPQDIVVPVSTLN
ncbi:MAG TPA: hypothetical protein ENJ90_06550 [Devosia sp.]|nr:hypothetical protein [Devosia sp.]